MKTILTLRKACRPAGNRLHAFTLIELLVVITIIGILAGVAVPVYTKVIMQAHQNTAMQKTKQIGIALRAFANDNNGAFPAGKNSYGEEITTSNDAFRSLIPVYLDSEAVFTVSDSKFGPKADEKIETAAEILQKGENHFAYVAGLSDTSKSQWPLIADGTDGHGTFATDESQVAGTWRGTRGVLFHVDTSASLIAMKGLKEQRFLPRYDDPEKNALAVSEYMGADVKLLDPSH